MLKRKIIYDNDLHLFSFKTLILYIHFDEEDKYSALLLFYLANTCRNNETMCVVHARYYERKYVDF